MMIETAKKLADDLSMALHKLQNSDDPYGHEWHALHMTLKTMDAINKIGSSKPRHWLPVIFERIPDAIGLRYRGFRSWLDWHRRRFLYGILEWLLRRRVIEADTVFHIARGVRIEQLEAADRRIAEFRARMRAEGAIPAVEEQVEPVVKADKAVKRARKAGPEKPVKAKGRRSKARVADLVEAIGAATEPGLAVAA